MQRIAEQISQYKCKIWVNDTEWKDEFIIPLLIVQDSQDREEVVENDWAELCVDEIFEYLRSWPYCETDYVSVREIIEKHAPIVKKFTMEDIERWTRKNMYPDHERSIVLNEFKFFFRVNWLLEE
jgi:hypothetical protein